MSSHGSGQGEEDGDPCGRAPGRGAPLRDAEPSP